MPKCSALLRGLCLALVIVAFPFSANAQQTIKLTIIDAYPPKALWVKVLIDYYIPEVEQAAGQDRQ